MSKLVRLHDGRKAVFCGSAGGGMVYVTPLDALVSLRVRREDLVVTTEEFRPLNVDPTSGRRYHKGRAAVGQRIGRKKKL